MSKEALPAPKIKVGRGLLWSETRDGYLFILPWLLGFLIFTAGPMMASLFISFTRWEIVTPSVWVGAAQYVKLLNDDRYWLSLYNTSYYVFIGVPLHLFMALLTALAVNMNLRGYPLLPHCLLRALLDSGGGQFDPVGVDYFIRSGDWPMHFSIGWASRGCTGCKTRGWPSRP